jgi:hypothetical protein
MGGHPSIEVTSDGKVLLRICLPLTPMATSSYPQNGNGNGNGHPSIGSEGTLSQRSEPVATI